MVRSFGLVLTLIFVSLFRDSAAFAQGQWQDLAHSIAIAEFDKNIQNPTQPLPGATFQTLMSRSKNVCFSQCCISTAPALTPTPTPMTGAAVASATSTPSNVEVLLVLEVVAPQNTSLTKLPWNGTRIRPNVNAKAVTEEAQLLGIPIDGNLNLSSAQQIVQSLQAYNWIDGSGQPIDTSILRDTFIAEYIVQQGAKMVGKNDKEIAKEIGKFIRAIAPTREARLNLSAALMDRFYDNYNEAKNPASNTLENNPTRRPLPGDFNYLRMLQSAAINDPVGGEVCNGITTQAILQTMEVLQEPDTDLLAINEGTHFGLLLVDKDGARVIDGGTQFLLNNRLTLEPDSGTSNFRISKLVEDKNGDFKLRQVAELATQEGVLIARAFGNEKEILSSGRNFSSAMVSVTKALNTGTRVQKKMVYSLAAGKLSNSNMIIVVAKYDRKSPVSNLYAGGGIGIETLDTPYHEKSSDNFAHIFIRAGYEHMLVHYQSPSTSVNKLDAKLSSGVRMEASASFADYGSISDGKSASLNLNQKLDAKYVHEHFKANLSASLTHSLGTKDWNGAGAASTDPEKSSIWRTLQKTSFIMNSVRTNAGVEVPLNDSIAAKANFEYLGSNVGIIKKIIAGIDIKASTNAKFYIYTGAASNSGGFKTKNSLLYSVPSGGIIGANAKLKRKTFNVQMNGIGHKKAGFNIQATLPLKK